MTLVTKRGLLVLVWTVVFVSSVFFKLASFKSINTPYLGYLFPLALAAVALALKALPSSRFARPWSLLTLTGLLGSMGFLDIGLSQSHDYQFERSRDLLARFSPQHLSAVAAAVLLACLVYYRLKAVRIQAVLLAAVLLSYGFMFLIFGSQFLPSILGGVFTIIVLCLLSFYFAVEHRTRMFNFFVFLVAVRFIGVYFQAFGRLLATGFELIFSGIFILAVAYQFNKNRKRIQHFLESFSP